MSTKTTFKRIALVAVSALGFGVLSVVPSQAAAGPITLTATTGTQTISASSETSTGALITVSSLLTAGTNDSVTVSFIATGTNPTDSNVRPVMTFIDSTSASSGAIRAGIGHASNGSVANFRQTYTPADSVTAGTKYVVQPLSGVTSAQIVGASFRLSFDSSTATNRKAGTYNYLIISEGFSGGLLASTVTQAVTLTVAAPAVVVPAAANAKAVLQAAASWPVGAGPLDSVTAGSLVTSSDAVGVIRVSNFSATDVATPDTMTVTMTGPGFLVIGGVTGRSFVVAPANTHDIAVRADGTSGEAKINITTAAGASFVKSVVFYDTKPTKITATVQKAFIKAGTASVADVFGVVVTDGLGNAIKDTGVVVTAAATDTATTVGGAATCAWDASVDMYECAVAGKAADKFGPVAYTITATGTGINAATKITTSATVTFADNVATKAVLAGPATGTPGATVEYTLTLTEKNGYPVADQTYGVNGAGGALFASSTVSGWSTAPFSTSESFTAKSGVITSKGILPIAGVATGSWTLIGDGISSSGAIDKTIGKTKITVSTEVANPGVDAATDAANEATDAANAATDAALAAAEAADAATTAAQEASDAVAALSESVTKLIAGLQAQIKSLAAVVAKIAKKVKA